MIIKEKGCKPPPDDARVAMNLSDIDVLLVSYDHSKYLDYDAIKY